MELASPLSLRTKSEGLPQSPHDGIDIPTPREELLHHARHVGFHGLYTCAAVAIGIDRTETKDRTWLRYHGRSVLRLEQEKTSHNGKKASLKDTHQEFATRSARNNAHLNLDT